jgi:NAD(P)H-dependent FMN reductase
MKRIVILQASVRKGAKSPRVAHYFQQFITERKLAEVEILDLAAYQFPVFEERLRFQENPSEQARDFAAKIKAADGVLIVTPEYNGGYPASLKNVIDLLIEEWKHKPVGIAMVSAGPFGGTQVITSLLFTLWKIGAIMVPAMFPVPNVDKSFDEQGTPTDAAATDARAEKFIAELLWCVEKLS